jgi:hypothetical protein
LRILLGNAPDALSRTPKALGEQQFGLRKRRKLRRSGTVLLGVYKVPTNLMGLTRTDDGTFDNDAKACYDRIIPNVTSSFETSQR